MVLKTRFYQFCSKWGVKFCQPVDSESKCAFFIHFVKYNKQQHRKVLTTNFHFRAYNLGFQPHPQNMEPQSTCESMRISYK